MILKHRDRELLRFDWIKPFGVRNVELNRRENQFLPLAFRDTAEKGCMRDLIRALENWLMRRTAPMNRRFVRDLLVSAGFNPSDPAYLRRMIEFCKGLSLNDVHWIVPDDFRGTWRDCNLYCNAFPESVAALAFSGMGRILPTDATTSPEYTTNGALAKCWRRSAAGICLWKAGSEASLGREPLAEFYATQVADALGVEHVRYRLARYKNRICSVCPLFTDERKGFAPVGQLLTREQIVSDRRFADVFLLDAVVLNDDRHLGNFGFLIDHDRNEVCGVAPAFDNGHSFFARPPDRFAEGSPVLYEHWTEFPGVDRAHARERLLRLAGFRLKKDARFNLPNADCRAAKDFLSRRIDALLDAYSRGDPSGPVNVGFTGPSGLLHFIRDNPGLRTAALAMRTGLTPRTVKRYLSLLKSRVVFKGAPKTGGYHVRLHASRPKPQE